MSIWCPYSHISLFKMITNKVQVLCERKHWWDPLPKAFWNCLYLRSPKNQHTSQDSLLIAHHCTDLSVTAEKYVYPFQHQRRKQMSTVQFYSIVSLNRLHNSSCHLLRMLLYLSDGLELTRVHRRLMLRKQNSLFLKACVAQSFLLKQRRYGDSVPGVLVSVFCLSLLVNCSFLPECRRMKY
jgi:hypothetical protein